MKIYYIVYNDWTKEQRKILRLFGMNPEEGFCDVEIEENEKNAELVKLIDKWKLEKFVATVYDKQDYSKSSLFVYVGTRSHGYPQPEDDFGFINLTYKTDDYCKKCGIGKVQKEPFRLKEPKWGNKMMFELNWIFDEVFVKKELYENLFKKLGLECWPVILHKKNVVIDNTVQLKIPVVKIPLSLEKQPYQTCKLCKKKKYDPQVKGFFPGFTKKVPDLPIFKSSEYFGDGLSAINRIFINRQLYTELEKLKTKPTFWPVDYYR